MSNVKKMYREAMVELESYKGQTVMIDTKFIRSITASWLSQRGGDNYITDDNGAVLAIRDSFYGAYVCVANNSLDIDFGKYGFDVAPSNRYPSGFNCYSRVGQNTYNKHRGNISTAKFVVETNRRSFMDGKIEETVLTNSEGALKELNDFIPAIPENMFKTRELCEDYLASRTDVISS